MKFYEVIVRLLLAIIIGGALGYEREHNKRPAGFRTHILVCLGAAVISMIQQYTINDTIILIKKYPELSSVLKADSGRLGAQVVSGIGFLGAGTIIHEKGSVKGLTTAASIWVVACMGLAIGSGYYTLSILSAICAVIVLVLLKRFEDKFFYKGSIVKIQIESSDKAQMAQVIADFFRERNIKIKNIEISLEDDHKEGENFTSLYTIFVPKYVAVNEILNGLSIQKNIFKVTAVEHE